MVILSIITIMTIRITIVYCIITISFTVFIDNLIKRGKADRVRGSRSQHDVDWEVRIGFC